MECRKRQRETFGTWGTQPVEDLASEKQNREHQKKENTYQETIRKNVTKHLLTPLY